MAKDSEMRGQVSEVIDYDGEVSGFKFGGETTYHLGPSKFRAKDKPFEIPKVGEVVDIIYNYSPKYEKNYIASIKIVEDAVQQDLSKEVSPPPYGMQAIPFDRIDKEKEIDYSVKETKTISTWPSFFDMKTIGIYYSVAEKIAAEKVHPHFLKDEVEIERTADIINKMARYLTIQTCKDIKDIYDHLKEEEQEGKEEE